MATILDTLAPVPVTIDRTTLSHDTPVPDSETDRRNSQPTPTVTPANRRVLAVGLTGVRLAIGFEFLWAFLDKTFGLGYSTTSGHAWINGGSPTTGFLSGVNSGPLQGVFHWLAGVTAVDWLFMLGLLGVGVALVVGVALRPAAIAGCAMLAMMYMATWPFAKFADGEATHSTNPIVDDHIVSIVALVVIGALAAWSIGPISRRWSELDVVKSHSWLR
jgi:thiosulfate dehydrogenase [quinone] large subunit